MAREKKANQKKNNGANIGYEAELWRMADALRGSMDAAEYKHVVLGLIFLKYISDAFEEQHAKLEAQKSQGADPEDQDEYRTLNIFRVPPEARWSYLKAQAKQSTIAQLLGTLDDKIELNQRMNEMMEAMARAIFKSWFVDFDPVRVKAEGREPGLPKHIANLFPDRFEAEGTVFSSISKKDFHNIQRIMSPVEVVNAFEHIAAPIDGKIANNEIETYSLATLRDTLLPKLLSGKLRVKGTTETVGAVA